MSTCDNQITIKNQVTTEIYKLSHSLAKGTTHIFADTHQPKLHKYINHHLKNSKGQVHKSTRYMYHLENNKGQVHELKR